MKVYNKKQDPRASVAQSDGKDEAMADSDEVKTVQKRMEKAGFFATKVGYVAIGLLVGIVIGIAAMLFLQTYNPEDKQKAPEILAASTVFERIVAENEMVTASQKYNITEKAGNVGYTIPFTDVAIPFTGNSFWYRYVGVLKASVNLETAAFDESGQTLTVELDAPQISSNTPDREQSGVLEESNNVLNPIHIEDVDAFLSQCQSESERIAVEGGLLDEARANAEANITGMFNAALGDGYTVVVKWRG